MPKSKTPSSNERDCSKNKASCGPPQLALAIHGIRKINSDQAADFLSFSFTVSHFGSSITLPFASTTISAVCLSLLISTAYRVSGLVKFHDLAILRLIRNFDPLHRPIAASSFFASASTAFIAFLGNVFFVTWTVYSSIVPSSAMSVSLCDWHRGTRYPTPSRRLPSPTQAC